MAPGLPTTALAAHNSRSRVVRDEEGTIHVFWGMLSLRMTQGEFSNLAGLVGDAAARPFRRGELARCPRGRVTRCSMGQIMVSHRSLTLWFSSREFEEFCQLVAEARRQLADAAPLPHLGLPWRLALREPVSPN